MSISGITLQGCTSKVNERLRAGTAGMWASQGLS
jgi:hypothetical protein